MTNNPRAALLAALLAFACCGCAAQRSAGRLDGYYSFETPVPVFDVDSQDWHDEKGLNCLRLKTFSDGTIGFQVSLVETNAHLCTMTGVAQQSGEAVVFQGGAEQYPGGCTLRIDVLPDKFVLHDDGLKCRLRACGARATLDGAEFLRASRVDDGPICVED